MSQSETPNTPATLDALLTDVPAGRTTPPLPVADITLDSRRVTPGSVFFALDGTSGHGLDHLQQALDA
ncbi:MAG TPA: hypothetical protein VJ947_01695, partial [Pseudohaliea sp.]|nr:hypothetical protein [Pseudohaliea sp.]